MYSFFQLLPSTIAYLSILLALTNIRLVFENTFNLELCIYLVFLSITINAINFILTDFLNVKTIVKEKLDSFSDLLNFGIVPFFITYATFFQFNNDLKYNYLYSLFLFIYPVCISYKLASSEKNNKNDADDNINDENQSNNKQYYKGIPVFIAALLMIIMPLFVILNEINVNNVKICQYIFIYIVIISFLSVSNFKTVSPHNVNIKKHNKIFIVILLSIIWISFYLYYIFNIKICFAFLILCYLISSVIINNIKLNSNNETKK